MEFTAPDGQMYVIEVIATGEVRDADGNLVEQNAELKGQTEPMTASEVDEIVERITKP